MALSPTFKEKFEDENRMPGAFYQWMQACPVLWIKGEAHSDFMTYLFQSTGEVIVTDQKPKLEFVEDGSQGGLPGAVKGGGEFFCEEIKLFCLGPVLLALAVDNQPVLGGQSRGIVLEVEVFAGDFTVAFGTGVVAHGREPVACLAAFFFVYSEAHFRGDEIVQAGAPRVRGVAVAHVAGEHEMGALAPAG